ncbi:hypothetical protein, partial [Methylobacterium sp. sgz302003]|uniref:hypothetical protein n=1 Tax=Methylobacterium oryzisoli TaxID=3385502 RepID=UPI003977F4A9
MAVAMPGALKSPQPARKARARIPGLAVLLAVIAAAPGPAEAARRPAAAPGTAVRGKSMARGTPLPHGRG